MLDFTFSESLSARLERGAKAAVDFSVPMRAIADYMKGSTQFRFDDEEGPDGAKWKPSKAAVEEGRTTLKASGDLYRSITALNDATTAIAGTDLIYAAIHQFGGTIRAKNGKALRTPFGPRGSVTMPARPFLGFGPVDLEEIEFILRDHLDAALEAGA